MADWPPQFEPFSGMRSGTWPSGARSPKRVTLASNCRPTVPVGPWRCLPMMTSALPWTVFHFDHAT